MVMMHELAHCQQMNHSRNFWKARNKFADELRDLWTKGYTGDGLFGRGQDLYSGQYTEEAAPAVDDSPEHLCGGVYRSGGGKRGRKGGTNTSQLTYAEKKQRRIEKKFGKGGVSLGGDEDGRVKLENGKKPKGKPRVAGSVRGRELRAAAALARFDTPGKDLQADSDDDTTSEDGYDEPAIKIEAKDGDGNKILNDKGKSFVKVCGDEDPEDDDGARQEMAELSSFSQTRNTKSESMPKKRVITTISKATAKKKDSSPEDAKIKMTAIQLEKPSTAKPTIKPDNIHDDESTESEAEEVSAVSKAKTPVSLIDDEETASEAEEKINPKKQSRETGNANHSNTGSSKGRSRAAEHELESTTSPIEAGINTTPEEPVVYMDKATRPQPLVSANSVSVPAELLSPPRSTDNLASTAPKPGICPVCSLENDADALRCAVCAHVLVPSSLPGCWPCRAESCKNLGYLNVGDNGICGLCGGPKA